MTIVYKNIITISLLSLLFSYAAISSFAQDLPSKIRGYKVHKDIIQITAHSEKQNASPGISTSVGEVNAVKVGYRGLTFALPLEFTSENQSGKVDMIDFHGLKVNGIPIQAEEYLTGFTFKRSETIVLPKPLQFVVAPERLLQAAIYEAFDQKDKWNVTGRVFIFGRFKKFGFYHKRAMPVDIDIYLPNPLLKKNP